MSQAEHKSAEYQARININRVLLYVCWLGLSNILA